MSCWKRGFDIIFAILIVTFSFIPLIIIGILIKIFDRGDIIFWSTRVGRNNKPFEMPKFRTMRSGAPIVATDDLDDPNQWITPLGYYLRKTSIDELPQLWSILKGDMSFVGPRPALVSEKKLINIRTEKMIHTLVPGLTGLAQVNGRDEISVLQKANYDLKYYEDLSLLLDMKIILTTVYRVLLRQGITH